MVKVERPNIEPYVGAVLLRGDDEWFIDTGVDLPGFDPHVFLGPADIRAVLSAAGWPSPEDAAELRERVGVLEAENAELRASAADADRFAEAAEYTLGRFGQKVVRKPGPRKVGV